MNQHQMSFYSSSVLDSNLIEMCLISCKLPITVEKRKYFGNFVKNCIRRVASRFQNLPGSELSPDTILTVSASGFRSDITMLYNDRAVLENHHISAAFRLMKEDEFNVLSNLKREEYRSVKHRDVVRVNPMGGVQVSEIKRCGKC